jgi:hypothetical protein
MHLLIFSRKGGQGNKKQTNIQVRPRDEIVRVARVAEGGGDMHRRRHRLVVVDVVVGMNRARGQGELPCELLGQLLGVVVVVLHLVLVLIRHVCCCCVEIPPFPQGFLF